MRPVRPAFAIGALAALFVGGVALATSRNSSDSSNAPSPVPQQVFVPPVQPLPAAPADVETAAPARERVVVRERVATSQPRTVRRYRVATKTRSGKKSALIIGGSAAGGAVAGALIGGKKGAVIGGLVGGGAGTVYDRKTRKKKVVVRD